MGISEKCIALQRSKGTPSKYIEKNLDQTWVQMKITLENWYARSVQPITHFFTLDHKPQRLNESLPDYIQRFMDNAEKALTGKLPDQIRDEVYKALFIRSLYNKRIKCKVHDYPNVKTLGNEFRVARLV